MTLTILIDLDDTLLTNDIDGFQKAYFKLLAEALTPWAPPTTMMAAMMAAVKAMVEKTIPALTMEEQFDQEFYPRLGAAKADLSKTIDHFYSNIYPQLRSLTSPRPEAVNLIKAAFRRGWNVAVATNPMFPKTAVVQRLEWAQLSPAEYPFSMITSFETSHFCKPHPAYYAEILGMLSWPENPVVMIGDSLEADILPAEKIGLPTFWLHDHQVVEGRNSLSRSGMLEEILPWLEKIEMDQPCIDYSSVDATLATLQSTPAVFAEIARGLQPVNWIHRPGEGEWNLIEILAHLRDVDREVNFGRIRSTMRGDNPFLPGANTDQWVQERNYTTEEGTAALVGFTQSRMNLLDLLDGLNEETLKMPARHAIFGPTNLKELLEFIATHDRNHIRQACNTIE